MEDLEDHLTKCRQDAILNFGPLRRIKTEGEVASWLLAISELCDLEMVGWKRSREVTDCIARSSGRSIRFRWHNHQDYCYGWEKQIELVENGPQVWASIQDAIEYGKTDASSDQWGTLSWSAECCGGRWLHYHKAIVRQFPDGSYCSAYFHFFVTVIGDLIGGPKGDS